MSAPTPSHAAFRRLERDLTRRRLQQLDPRMRIELALLGSLIGAFLFWQVRVPLDGLVRARGPLAGLEVVLVSGLVLAALGAALAGGTHARRLVKGPRGPEWLALPCAPARLERHLAWDACTRLGWLAVPAFGVLAAGLGLMPLWWLLVLSAAFALVLPIAGIAGCRVAARWVHRAVTVRPGLHPIERLLAVAAPRDQRRRVPAAAWRARRPWRALAGKDLRLTWRLGPLRRTAALALAFAVASWLAWRIPGEPALRHFAAFGLAMLAAAMLAEWLVMLVGSDPFAALRVQPVGLASVWGARVAIGAAGALLLVIGHALTARGLSARALELFLVWSGLATLVIAALGVNYGVTLFPRADAARWMLGLTLGLAVAASIMLPLAGWIVLLTAVLHSLRRLPRWSRLEDV